MSPIIIVDNEYITLQYLPDKKIIYHTIHKPIADQMLKDALNAGTESLKEYGACKWLSDNRNNGPLSQEMVDWGLKDWDARTVAVGWRYWAAVVPQAAADAGSLMPLIDILFDMGLRMVLFTDLDKAFMWLDGIK